VSNKQTLIALLDEWADVDVTRQLHPNVPWSNMAKTPGFTGHFYHRRDPEVVFGRDPRGADTASCSV
jgi:hypothetical protein